jgi:hypothetical protein
MSSSKNKSNNILNSSIHKVIVGESLFLENEFFPYPPFEKYTYKILSKEESVTVTKKFLPQELVSLVDGNYTICNEIINFKFNFPGIVFFEIVNTTTTVGIGKHPPLSVIVEVFMSDYEDEICL